MTYDSDNTYSYTYNSAGLRTGKTSGGKTTEYIWSGDNIVREEETGKSIDYLYGINRVSRTIKGDNYRGTPYGHYVSMYDDSFKNNLKYEDRKNAGWIVYHDTGGIVSARITGSGSKMLTISGACRLIY